MLSSVVFPSSLIRIVILTAEAIEAASSLYRTEGAVVAVVVLVFLCVAVQQTLLTLISHQEF